MQFGDDGEVASDVDSGGHAQVFLDDAHEIAVEIPMFDAIIISVADEEKGFVVARIEGNSMAGFEFTFFNAGAAEGFDELAGFVELEDVIGTVTVGHED